MRLYLNCFVHLKRLIDESVSTLSSEFKEVPPRDLVSFVLTNSLVNLYDIYETLRAFTKHLKLLERGFTVELVGPVLKNGRFLGVYIDFVASRFSKTPITEVELRVGGILLETNGHRVHYDRGGKLRVSSIVGFEEELGDRYGEVRRSLERVLGEDEVEEELGELESYVCDRCDLCEVEADVRDTDGSLELVIEVLTEDFLCLPPVEMFEKPISTILRKAGIELRE
jgi:hypothetical protein